MENDYIAGFGDVMLRLAPMGKQRFAQALPGVMEATFGGGEANVCASLAILGARCRYLTALPCNPVSHAFAAQMRGLGVDVDHILYRPGGRMGVYYTESGVALRSSNVIYDREHSVISECSPDDYDFPEMLKNTGHLHLSGITPALSEKAFHSTLAIAEFAARHGIRISCDLNFRKKLWNWKAGRLPNELAEDCMKRIVAYADIIIGNEEDASEVFGISAEGSSVESGKIDIGGYSEVARKLGERFPKSSWIAITLRESRSADHNNWGGMLYEKASGRTFFAPLNQAGEYSPCEIHDIVDRFGGGDSFCAGLIFALSDNDCSTPAEAIRFAVAASCLKHSVKGDYSYITKSEVVALMNGNASGRVRR